MRIYVVALALMMVPLPVMAQAVPLPRERPPSLPTDATGDEPAEVLEAAPAPSPPSQETPADTSVTDEPARVYQTQCPAVVGGLVEAELLPPISENECGERTPWSVTGVRVGARMVPLSAPATLSCEMATNLPSWVEMVDGYLQAQRNTGLAELSVGTSYLCRDTVGGEAERVSEHGFANGLDVTGFTLNDDSSIVVQSDWPKPDALEGRFLRFAHDAACSLFSTTLGPEANEDHSDHFHLDMGCHGGDCAARLCQ